MKAGARFAFSLGVALALVVLVTPSASALTVDDVTKDLMCTCGCGKLLSNCDCDTAAQMQQEITSMISKGKTKPQIIAEFKATYGDNVLATPEKSDLELLLWVVPPIIALMGTVVIFQLARRKAPFTGKVGTPIADPTLDTEASEDEEAKYEAYFEEEYRKFKERENKK